jgi:hypothetical protein
VRSAVLRRQSANCPVLISGTLNGNRVRLSTAKYLPPDKARDLEAGRNLALLRERVGQTMRPEEYSAPAPKESDTKRRRLPLKWR